MIIGSGGLRAGMSGEMPKPADLRLEKIVVTAALLLTGFGPPLLIEGFPISAAHMFADASPEFWVYRLRDSEGERLNNDVYGLRSNTCWYLEPTYGVKFPRNVVQPPNRAPDFRMVIDHIRETGKSQGASFPLTFEALKIGDIDGRTVGIVWRDSWIVSDE